MSKKSFVCFFILLFTGFVYGMDILKKKENKEVLVELQTDLEIKKNNLDAEIKNAFNKDWHDIQAFLSFCRQKAKNEEIPDNFLPMLREHRDQLSIRASKPFWFERPISFVLKAGACLNFGLGVALPVLNTFVFGSSCNDEGCEYENVQRCLPDWLDNSTLSYRAYFVFLMSFNMYCSFLLKKKQRDNQLKLFEVNDFISKREVISE